MLRLTRGALTMLLAEYRSVLKNAYMKNALVAAVAVGAAVAAPAYAEGGNNGDQQQTEEGKDSDTKLCNTNTGSCTLEEATISKNYSTDTNQYGTKVTISGGTNEFKSGSSLNATSGDITVSGGTTALNGTTFNATNGSILLNGGTINAEGENTLKGTSGVKIAGTTLTNKAGSTLKVTGSDLTVSSGKLVNSGTIETTAANISGGTHTLNAGSKLTATNGVTVSGGTVDVKEKGTATVSDLNLKGGTFRVAGDSTLETGKLTISDKGALGVTGTLNATSAEMTAGTLNLHAGSTLKSDDIKVSGGTVTADGNSTLNGKVALSGGDLKVTKGALSVLGESFNVTGGKITNSSTLNLNSNTTNIADGKLVNASTGTVSVGSGAVATFEGFANDTLTGTFVNNGNAVFNDTTTIENIENKGLITANKGVTFKKGSLGLDTADGGLTVASGSVLDLTTFNNAASDGSRRGSVTILEDKFHNATASGKKITNNGTINAVSMTLKEGGSDNKITLEDTGVINSKQLIASGATGLDISGDSTITTGRNADIGTNTELSSDKYSKLTSDERDAVTQGESNFFEGLTALENFKDVTVNGKGSLTVKDSTVNLDSITLKEGSGNDATFTLTGNKSWVEGSDVSLSRDADGKITSTPLASKVGTVTIDEGNETASGKGLQLSSTELGIKGTTTINSKEGITLSNSTLHVDLGKDENNVVVNNHEAITSDKDSGLQYYNDSSVILVTGVQGGKITITDTDVEGDGVNDLGDIYEKLGIGVSAANSDGTNRQTINDSSRALLDIRDADGKKVTYEYQHRHTTTNGGAIDIKDILDHKSTNDVSNVATAAAQTDAFTGDRITDITKDEVIDQKLRVGSLVAQSNSTQVNIDANVKLFTATKNNASDENGSSTFDKYRGDVDPEEYVFVSRTNAEGDKQKADDDHNDGTHKLDTAANQTGAGANADGKHTQDSIAEAEKLLGVKLQDKAWLGLYNGGAIGFVEAAGTSSGTLYITGGRTLIKTDDRLDTDRSNDAKASDAERNSGIGTSTHRVGQVTIDRTTAVVEDYRYQNSDTTKNKETGVRDNLRDSYATNFTVSSLADKTGEFVVRTFDTKEKTSLTGILDVENTLQSGTLYSYGIYNDTKHTSFKDSSQLKVKNDANVDGEANLANTITTVQDVNGKYRGFTAGSLTVTGGKQKQKTSQMNAADIRTTSGSMTIHNSFANAHAGLDKDGNETKGDIYSAANMTVSSSTVTAEESIESKANMSHTSSHVTADQNIASGGTFYSSASNVVAENGDITSVKKMTVENNSTVIAKGEVNSKDAMEVTNSHMTAQTKGVTSSADMTVNNSDMTAQTAVKSGGKLTATNKSTVTAVKEGVSSSGDMTVTASTVKAQTSVESGGKLTASSASTITATTGDVTSSGDMSVTGNSTMTAQGKVEATSGKLTAENSSITATTGDISSGSDMKLTSSQVKSTAGSITSKGALTADSSTVTAKKDITASGNSSLTDSTVTAETGSIAVSGGKLDISGGKITAAKDISASDDITAKNTDVDAGEKLSSGGDLSVTDSTVDASSATVKGKLTTVSTGKETHVKTSSAAGMTVDGEINVGEGTSVETAKLVATDGTLDAITVAGALNVTGDTAVVSDKDLTVSGTMTTGGDITAANVENSGTIDSNGAFSATGNLTNSGTLTSVKDLTITGTTKATAGSISSTAGSIKSDGLFTMSGNASVSAFNNGTFNGGLLMTDKQNSLNVTSGDLTVDSKEFVLNGGTVNVQAGNAYFKEGADVTGTLAIQKNIEVNKSELKVGEGSTITAGENITLDKGANVKSNSTLAATGNIKSGGNVTLADSTTVKAKDLDITGTLTAGNKTTLTTTGNTTVSNGATIGDGSKVDTANITVSTGDLNIGKSSTVNTGKLTVATGNLKVDGGENTASTVNATDIEVTEGKADIAANSTVHATGNANVKNGGTVSGSLTVDGTLTSDKNFTVENGGELTATNSEYDQNFYVYGTSTIVNLTMKAGTDKDIYVGYTGATADLSQSGILITDTMRLNGRSVFVDPDYSKDASIQATLNFGGASDDNYTTVDGDLNLGQNAVISVGEINTASLFSTLHSVSDATGGSFMSSSSNAFTDSGTIQNLLYLNKSLRISSGNGFYSENITFIDSEGDTDTSHAADNTFTWGSGTGIYLTEKVMDYVNLDRSTRAAVWLENGSAGAVSVTNATAATGETTGSTQTLYISGNISRSEASRYPVFSTTSLGYANSAASTANGTSATVVSSASTTDLSNTSYYGTVLLDGVTAAQYLKSVDVEFVNNSYYDWSQATVYLLVDGTLSVDGIVGVKAEAVDLYDYLSRPSKVLVLNALTKYSSDNGLGAKYIIDRTDPSSGKDIEETSRLGIYGGMYQAAQGVSAAASEAALSAVGFGAVLPEAYIGEDIAVWTVLNYNNVNADSYSAEGQHYGVDIDLRGITIGGDHLFENGSRLGIFGSVGDGSSRGKDIASNVTNDFDYYGFGLYGHYPVTENFEIFGDAYMMRLSGDIYQDVASEDYGTLKADAHMKVYAASLYGKYTFDNEVVDVAPYAGVIFSHYKLDGYDVKSKDGVIASLDDDAQNVLSFPVGVTLSSDFVTENEWKLKPIFDARMTFNSGDRDVDHKVVFSGVDESQNYQTQVLDDVTYGASLKFEASHGAGTVGIGVSYVGSSHTDNYGVTANARYQF